MRYFKLAVTVILSLCFGCGIDNGFVDRSSLPLAEGVLPTWDTTSAFPPMLNDLSVESAARRAAEYLSVRRQCNLATCENCCLVTAIYVLTGRDMEFTDALKVRRFEETSELDRSKVYLFILDYHYLNKRGLPYFHAGIYYPSLGQVHSRIGNKWKIVTIEKYRQLSRSKGYTMHYYRW